MKAEANGEDMQRSGDPPRDAWLITGGGEMGELMRRTDWAATALGPAHRWPQSLRTAVSILLDSQFGMYIAWGPQYAQLYNDRYRPILGSTKHPQALGNVASETFAESWNIIGPMFEDVRRGKSVGSEDWMLPLERHGYLEECFFTFSYSPIRDESGGVGGVHVTVTETTTRVLAVRRLRALHALAETAFAKRNAAEACAAAAASLCAARDDVPFALFYLLSANGSEAHLAGCCGLAMGTRISPRVVPLSALARNEAETPASPSVWPIDRALSRGALAIVDDVEARFGLVASGKWPESVHTAALLPITRGEGTATYGVLVAGVSPRRALDADYIEFFRLVASQLATSVSDALAIEDERRFVASERERLYAHFMQAPFPIAVLRTREFIVDLANPAALAVWGKTPALVGQPLLQGFPELVGQSFVGFLDEVIRTGIPYEGKEALARLPRGPTNALEDVYFNFVYSPLRDRAGVVEGVLVAGFEVTAEVESRRKVDEAQRLFKSVVDNVPELAWTARPDGHIDFYNQRWYEYTGTTADEMEGWGWRSLHDPALLASVEARWAQSLSTGQTFEMEFPLRGADGAFQWFLCRVQALRDAEGRIARWFGTNTNVNALRVARERAETAAASLSRIQSVTEALSESMTPEDVADAVVHHAMAAFEANTCVLYAMSADGSTLDLVGDGAGVAAEILVRIRTIDLRDETQWVARAIREDRLIVVPDEQQYAAFIPEIAGLSVPGKRAKAFWFAPLVVGDRKVGALAMGFYRGRDVSHEERALIQTLLRQSAQALDRAVVYNQLSRSKKNFQAIFDQSLDAMLIADDHRRILDANPAAVSLIGGSREELLRSTVTDVMGGPQNGETFRLWDEFLKTGSQRGEVRLHRRDGTSVHVGYSAKAHFVPGQHLSVLRDVEAQKRAEALLRFLAEASTLLSSSLDYEATIASVTRLAVPMVADWASVDMLDASGAIQRLAVAHVDPTKVELAHEVWRRWPAKPDDPSGSGRVIRTGTSELFPAISDEMLVLGIPDPELLKIIRALGLKSSMCVPLTVRGRTSGAITFVSAESGRRFEKADLALAEDLARRAGIAVDNARLYQSEQNARQNADSANRAKDDFLATVSHELRTPLNAMLGWTRMLSAGTLPKEKIDRALQTIERNAVAQAQLIEDLLDVSRIISGKLRLDVHSVELIDIVEHAIDALRLATEARNIRILAALDPNAGPIMGDAHRLQQVVWNLLSNAIKFTPKGGRIHLALERVDSNLRIAVKDNGQGIEPDFLPHVFERFKQADGATTRAQGGLGLGLAISRHIVELHGGTIEVASKGKGHGSEFVVTLPVAPIRQGIRATSGRVSSPGPVIDTEIRNELKDLRVIVVDDDEDSRDLVVAALEQSGAIVSSAASAAEALSKIEKGRHDVLISDIGMPGEDGYALIRKVRSLPAADRANIPAAALTAYARAEDRRKALDAGFMMHIPKPVEVAELISVVANLTRFAVRR